MLDSKEKNKNIFGERLIFNPVSRCCLNEKGVEGEIMGKIKFKPVDIDASIVELVDMYVKSVVGKSKISQYRKNEKHKKSGIVIYRLDGFETDLSYEDSYYENLFSHRFIVDDEEFFIHNEQLAEALLLLTEIQRDILFQTEIAERSQRDIAKQYGFSFQMVSKHRQNALRKLREAMKNDKEK